MQCLDIMRRPVRSASVGESVAAAAKKMRAANIGFLAVCSSDGRVQGVVTDRDFAVLVCAEDRRASETKVDDVMSTHLVTCRPEDDVAVAEQRMGEYRKSRILVIDKDNRPMGVISLSDIALRDGSHASETLGAVSRREVLITQNTTAKSTR